MCQGGSGTGADRPEEGRRGMATVLFNWRCTQFASYQIYSRVVKMNNLNSHPNVLPIIGVSEALFPVCVMSPWMPDGNITQYIKMNRGGNCLMLVCTRRPGN